MPDMNAAVETDARWHGSWNPAGELIMGQFASSWWAGGPGALTGRHDPSKICSQHRSPAMASRATNSPIQAMISLSGSILTGWTYGFWGTR